MSSPPSLHGAVAKLDRAQEHFTALSAVIGELKGKGYAVCDEFDLADEWYIARFRLFEPTPLRWSTILGDAIQNTRAALDHVVYQLVRLSGNNPTKHSGTQWPVVSNKDDYWKGTDCAKPKRDTMLTGVDEVYRKLIDGFQPYDNVPGNPFLLFNRLSNADKHRILHASFLWPKNAAVGPVPYHPGWHIEFPKGDLGPLDDGTELYRWKVFTPEWPKIEVQVQGNITFGVAFGKRPNPTPLEAIHIGFDFIRRVIETRFNPLFAISGF